VPIATAVRERRTRQPAAHDDESGVTKGLSMFS
jgi:hypothetical protein